jgi:predicted Mrr-cat superfamily restriction endonuclease
VTRRDVVNGSRRPVDQKAVATNPVDTSDKALLNLLKRLKATIDPAEIRKLSDQIERVVFHKQFRNA